MKKHSPNLELYSGLRFELVDSFSSQNSNIELFYRTFRSSSSGLLNSIDFDSYLWDFFVDIVLILQSEIENG